MARKFKNYKQFRHKFATVLELGEWLLENGDEWQDKDVRISVWTDLDLSYQVLVIVAEIVQTETIGT